MAFADYDYMARALRLAARGMYTAHPNPRVGCVLVRDGEIVGEGWHKSTGEGHAEVNALAEAGERARGAIAYITLEPCCHYGRTPPCSEALIKAGVARAVVAMLDSNPQVAGQGLEQLRAAGIAVEAGLLQAQAEVLNPGFLMRMRNHRPFVRCKLAMSLDGRTALANGKSQWITGTEARADVQRLRARSGAIMTGIGTVLADDPALTVRWEALEGEEWLTLNSRLGQPLRVVMDTRLRMPSCARLLGLPGRTLVMTTLHEQGSREGLTAAGATIVAFPDTRHGVDLPAALRYLAAAHEVNEVLLEAGPTLSGAMLQAGLIDELVIYIAPMLLGNSARGLVRLLPTLEDMRQRIELEITDVRAIGGDWRITAMLAKGTMAAR